MLEQRESPTLWRLCPARTAFSSTLRLPSSRNYLNLNAARGLTAPFYAAAAAVSYAPSSPPL
jgi:hypothetical protein